MSADATPSARVSQVPDRIVLLTSAALTAVAWFVTIRSAREMSASMTMPGGWSMSMIWMGMPGSTLERAAMFLAMWTTMMVAMMLPSVMPAVLLHGKVLTARRERNDVVAGSQLALLLGYFSIWALFGLAAYALGSLISSLAAAHIAISVLIPAAIGVTLVAAGVYELTPWKDACLQHCRSPLEFFARHDLRSRLDSFRLGLHHGTYCAGCCWGLMAMQLVIGVMSLPMMAVVSLIVFLEKQWSNGELVAAATGIVAIAVGEMLLLLAFLR
jgi:predicted metal-binding membrane protein